MAFRVLGICGSLRAKSYNMAALKAAGDLMPADLSLTITQYADIPLYNQDVQDKGFPEPVMRLNREILDADAILIASPEYNYSVSGVLKNALDWLSRIQPAQPFKNKPVAIISATGGPLGGARNQYELRKILGCFEAHVLARPEIFIGMEQTKFDAELKLTDEPTRKILGDQMKAFVDHITKVKKGFA